MFPALLPKLGARVRQASSRFDLKRAIGFHWTFPLFAAVLIALVWAVTLHLIALDRARASNAARDSVRIQADVYEAQLMHNLGAIDGKLKTIRYAAALKGGNGALVDLTRQRLLPTRPEFAIGMVDRDGRLVASTQAHAIADLAGQPSFERLRRDDADRMMLAYDAARSRLIFMRRLAADGSFGGAAVISVDARYFAGEYDAARFGQAGLLALADTDGTLVIERVGERMRSGLHVNYAELQARIDPSRQARGDRWITPWDGITRYTDVRAVRGLPLVSVVGLSRDEQLAAWRINTRGRLEAAATASLLLALAGSGLCMLAWQLARQQRRAQRAREAYHAASEASLDAFFVLRSLRDATGRIADFELSEINRRGIELCGKPKHTLVGKTLSALLVHGRENPVFEDCLSVAQDNSAREREWETSGGRARKWLYRQVVGIEDGVVAIVRDITERKRAELLRTAQGRVLELIATGTPLPLILAELVGLVESQTHEMVGAVLLPDADTQHFRVAAGPHLPAAHSRALKTLQFGVEASPCGLALSSFATVIVEDLACEQRWQEYRALVTPLGLRACWALPIMSQLGVPLGVLAMYARRACRPGDTDAQLLAVATRMAGIAIEREQAEERIRHMATHDALTGLPNRTLLGDRLEQAIAHAQRYARQVSVVFVDLDNFKLINDSLGHQAGDALLAAIAERMQASLRATDTVVRLGGDEFVVVLFDQERGDQSVAQVLERLRANIERPLALDAQTVCVACSMGVATYPRDGTTQQALLVNADAAMYRAKEVGRNNTQFYAPSMNAHSGRKLVRLEALRNAVSNGELMLLYQPQFDLQSRRMFGVEALVRWKHPEWGLLSPDQFIPLAEESGLIVPIGSWVLSTACRQNKAWQDAGFPPITMSVNMSARQFLERDLVERVRQVLNETELEARYLELELTESLLMTNLDDAIIAMQRLRDIGVNLAIDDFGIGYSSLSALKHFPVGRLKIDKSFVRNLPDDTDDRTIALSVISLGHQLNLKVVAEGVETAEQLAFLQRNACDQMQGFLLSKPIEASEVVPLFGAAPLGPTVEPAGDELGL